MKLVEARAAKLLTVRELATKAGVESKTVYSVEKGLVVPTLTTVRKLSEALEIDPKEIDEFRAAIERTIQGRERE